MKSSFKIIAKFTLIDKVPFFWYICTIMYAIVESGNKQYKVEKGTVIDVELLEAVKDNDIILDRILLVSDGDNIVVGTPYIKGAALNGTVVDEIKDKKVTSFKYKNKTGYHRTIGHRQRYTRVKVNSINY